MTSDVARFTGSIPQHYDRGLGPIIFDGYAADMARRVAAFSPKRVLEIAAGTGIVTRHLRDRLPVAARLIATDLNPPMLEIARAKFRSGEAVEFQPADALALPFADGDFDTVVCQFGVMFFPDKDKACREVARVLAPGGRYVFSIWDTHLHNSFGRIAHEVVGRFFPENPPQFQKLPFSCAFDPIKDSLIGAGFADIIAAVVRLDKDLPDATAFARGLVHGSPLIEQIEMRGGVEPDDVVEALVQEFHRECGADPGRLSLQAIVFSATAPS